MTKPSEIIDECWDISKATYLQSFSTAEQSTYPKGIFISPDNRKMYITGTGNIYEYDLLVPGDISTASFLQTIYVQATARNPTGVFFSPDGRKMYVTTSTNGLICEYDLSIAWNISTASHLHSFRAASEGQSLSGLFFGDDGRKMYVANCYPAPDLIHEYDLATPWNISTASNFQSLCTTAQDDSPSGVFLKSDGTKMYVIGGRGDRIIEYDLSIAWNVTTAIYNDSSIPISDYNPNGMFINSRGTKMYVVGSTSSTIFEYDMPECHTPPTQQPDINLAIIIGGSLLGLYALSRIIK